MPVWVRKILTTLLWLVPILITILVGWYQISYSERQAAQAELERARSIRAAVVAIVEDHVINGKPIDSSRTTRLIEVRRKEESVKLPISVSEIYERAEFNILNTRYLDFGQKEKYNTVFDQLYKGMAPVQPTEYSGQNADLLNELARNIRDGKTPDALANLDSVAKAFQSSLSELEARRFEPLTIDEIVRQFSKPAVIATLVVFYVFVIFFFPPYRRLLRRILGLEKRE